MTVEPLGPSKGFANRVGGRAGQHGHGRRTGADDPGREQREVNAPATGRSALAAWAEVWMSVVPLAFRVAAVPMMIKSATRLETPMPTMVSVQIRANSAPASRGAMQRRAAVAALVAAEVPCPQQSTTERLKWVCNPQVGSPTLGRDLFEPRRSR